MRDHILVFNRSFWPDIEATGQFLTELCEQLVKKYRVTVIAGCSYYIKKESFKKGRFYAKEIYNGIEIIRVRHTRFWKARLIGRIANWITYGALSFCIALRIKPKLIIACTDPPFLGIMAMVLSRLKSAPFMYNCRDLYPDVAVELGKLDRNNFLGRIFNYFNVRAFNSALAVICLGQSMEGRIRAKGLRDARITVVPDWVGTSKIRPVSKYENPLLDKFGLRNKFVIMHSGNMGLSQDFTSILYAMSIIQDRASFHLVFVGEGAGKDAVKEKINLLGIKNVLFISYQPQDMLSFSLGMADLHIITLKKGMSGAIVPSKVYGIMAAGRPYLAITDKESEPARMALEFKCGLWTEPENPKAVSETISWAINHPAELEEMGKIGRHIAETKFDKSIVINDWFTLLESSLQL